MEVDYLIIGQGICGTFLSYYLLQKGKSLIVIDESNTYSASKVASGVINPVTGRRIVNTWMIDELLPFAQNAYDQIGRDLNIEVIKETGVLDFHATPQMKDAFAERIKEDDTYLSETQDEMWNEYFRFNYGIGQIKPCLLIDIQLLLNKWRLHLLKKAILREELFDFSQFTVDAHNSFVQYKDIKARKIIFCDGVAGFDNIYFNKLPYMRTKGEALIAEIEGLPRTNIFKQGISIVSWKEDLFWIGSSYEWNYKDVHPTDMFRRKTEQQLSYWLKLPFKIIDHLASERPANVERRPFVGLHPLYKCIGILNGMGTKGCSLAPFFANELVQYLLEGIPINNLADVSRFERVLSR